MDLNAKAKPHVADCSIKQLLSHTCGMPSGDTSALADLLSTAEHRAGLIAEAAAAGPGSEARLFQPGEGFAYSNLGFDLLGPLVEHATGLTYEAALR